MKIYKYILIFLAIIVVFRIYYLFFRNTKEGFDSFTKFKKIGFPHDFCMSVPVEAYIGPPIYGTFIEKKFNTF